MAPRTPQVEFLWWSGCPSWERALARLRDEMADLGLDPSLIEMREVETSDAAKQEDFVGSPTIRVDGRDVQATDDQPVGLTCRIYRLRDGRVSPLPDPAELRDALVAASAGTFAASAADRSEQAQVEPSGADGKATR